MKISYVLLAVALITACAKEKAGQEEKEQQIVKAISQPATDATDEDPIPAGAFQETFEDKPGLVRLSVKDIAGVVSIQGNYLNGKREGIWAEFNPNGILKNATSYVNGKKEGLFIELNPSGQMIKRFFYHNGIRHGEYKEFNYSSLKEERTYVNGKLEGIVKIYYDGAKIMEEGAYQNGLREGISKWYDQNGNVTITYEYKKGELVKK